jgi:hypothetical protein
MNGNGASEPEDVDLEVEELKPVFAEIMQRRMAIEDAGLGEDEQRAAIEQTFKEQMRAAFLTHAIATEEDFNRLWPRLRDDALCEHATTVYFQVIDALVDDMDDEDF